MDRKTIKEMFEKYYGETSGEIYCVKMGYGVKLFGNFSEQAEIFEGGISLSINTCMAISLKNDNKFDIIQSNRDIKYRVDFDDGEKRTDDSELEKIKKICAVSKGTLKGGNILIMFDCDGMTKPLTTLMCGLEIAGGSDVPDLEKVCFMTDESDGEKNTFLPAELYGRKNTLIYGRKNGMWEYLPFNMEGYKIILAYAKIKEVNINKIFGEEKFKDYIKAEEKRTEILRKIIKEKKCVCGEVGAILNSSHSELLKLLGRSGEELNKIYRTAVDTGICICCVPIYESGGICAIVKNELVDDYTRIISCEYQKKAGEKPALFICDSDDSCVLI